MNTESCNCTWPDCPVHQGNLCSNNAVARECEHTDRHHAYIGSVFGEGVHLCDACGIAISDMLITDVGDLMNGIHHRLPVPLRPLSEVLSDYFQEVTNWKTGAWREPIRDVRAILAFIYLASHDRDSQITERELQITLSIAMRLSSLDKSITAPPIHIKKEG